MDLDNEELEATRRLNGVAKMSDIGKDIKRCEELIKPEHANWIGISNQLAIAHVVDRAKEVENDLTTAYLKGYADAEEKHKKRIKELEEENRIFKDSNVLVNRYFKLKDNSIPVQKVKDKIEENNKIMIDTQNKYPGTYAMLDEWRNAKAQNDILEELLEDK